MSDAFRFADTDNGKTWLWVALVSTASLVLSFSLACAVPLAAFAALAGLHMRKGAGLALVAAAWLVNQIVGREVDESSHQDLVREAVAALNVEAARGSTN